MKRVSVSALAVFLALLVNGETRGQDVFDLGFSGPVTVTGNAGQVVTATYDLTMAHTMATLTEGPKGWSISLTADGPALITDITIDGSGIDDEFDCPAGPLCFDPAESGDFPDFPEVAVTPDEPLNPPRDACEGKRGATAAIVMAFQDPVTLPPNVTTVIAIITVEFTIPDGGGTATLRYADGCVGGGQPVDNVVTLGSATVPPNLGTLEVNLVQEVNNCTMPFTVGFSDTAIGGTEDVESPGRGEASKIALPGPAFVGILGVETDGGVPAEGERCGAGGQLPVEGSPGGTASGVVYANIVQQTANPDNVIQGWTLSIPMETTDDSVRLMDATTDGTIGLDMQDSGFDATGIVDEMVEDPDNPGSIIDQGQGATSAVVLAFQRANSLADGTSSVLALTVEGTVPMENGGSGAQAGAGEATFRFVDGLIGGGQPVPNVLTVSNLGSVGLVPDQPGDPTIANAATAAATVQLVPLSETLFLRGNANNDNKVNIADPIYIINRLFRPPAPEIECMDAADANDDGMVDLGDALLIIAWNFQVDFPEDGISAPESLPPPFSAAFDMCGPDPTEDELPCEATQTLCP